MYKTLKRVDAWHRLAWTMPSLTGVLRFMSFLGYRLLELVLGRRHPHNRVVAQARELYPQRVAQASGTSADQHVLFFTVRGWFAHVTTEAVLAAALRFRGASATFYLCGGMLRQCDFKPGSDPHVTRPLCWRCTGFPRRLLAAFGFPHLEMRDLLSESEQRRLEGRVEGLAREELLAFKHDGYQVGQYVLPSVQRSLLRDDVGGDPRSVEVLRGYVASAIVTVEICARLLARRTPDVVVITNGSFFAERVMMEVAHGCGIRIVAYERGMRTNSLVVEKDRPVVPFELDDHWERVKDTPLHPSDVNALSAYLDSRRRGDVGTQDLWPEMVDDPSEVLQRVGTDHARPLVVAFTNVLWDSAVFRREVAFDGMFDWLRTIISIFERRPHLRLAVRVHPAETRIPMSESRDRVIDRLHAEYESLPENVRIIGPEDPTSSYALIDSAATVLTYTSTIGLEAANRGAPVVVAGDTHYARKGFTYDVDEREQLANLIDEAITQGGLNDGQFQLARRYAHMFFLRYMPRFPWVDDSSRAARRLTFGELADLAPGRDPRLDRLCDVILHGSEVMDV